ncbi:MAG TPA: hypothetical protein PK147_11165 [Saprospiraceae bacterium]|nr:hypothetical protein [Saprospiraceae bacterium]MCB9328466.1 hypothetical protein [Lewinellaceae bacterium]HPK10787.1 hypothetical protein [Saprospiraceae bacterium]HPQ22405.1 hypothetical protein [Saprospiraceae bacterium]HRX28112.1 hypothetical protein [Saprospiraceae bacterium]
MYKDLINYELADGVTESQLLEVANRVYHEWMKDLDGFISWEINKISDNNYMDIVVWTSKEASLDSEKSMDKCTSAGDWFSCYKPGSINSKFLYSVKNFE